MSGPPRIPLSGLQEQLKDRFHVFVCSASFETRSRSVADALPPSLFKRVLVCANDEFASIHATKTYLLDRFGRSARSIALNAGDPLFTADRLQSAIASTVTEGCRSYLIDITTFTHESLLILLRVLQIHLQRNETVQFVYTGALDYSLGDEPRHKWLSKGINDIRSVLGYPGRVLPTKRLHLIVLAGFESERAERLIDEFEPNIISLGVGDPEQSVDTSLHQINKEFHGRLVEKFKGVGQFRFSCTDPRATAMALKRQVASVPGHNVLISPMNNKISTIGAALTAFDDDDIQLCYATANEYNEDNYSSPRTDCYLFSVAEIFGRVSKAK